MRLKTIENVNKRWHDGCGFNSIVKHPTMSASEIEGIHRWCFEQDFQRLGPSIYRFVEMRCLRHKKWTASSSSFLQEKAASLTTDLRKAYQIFLVGRLRGPNGHVRSGVRELEYEVRAQLGNPTLPDVCMLILCQGRSASSANRRAKNVDRSDHGIRDTDGFAADRWGDDPDVGFDNVARIFPFVCTTLVHNLI